MTSPSTPLDHDADEFAAGRDLVEERAKVSELEILTVHRARRLASGDLTFAVVVRLERADIVAKVGEWRTEVRATKSWNPDTVIMVDPDESPPHTSSPGGQFAAAKLRFASLLGELDDAAARLPRDGQRKLWDALLTDVGERLVATGGEP